MRTGGHDRNVGGDEAVVVERLDRIGANLANLPPVNSGSESKDIEIPCVAQ